MQLMFLRSMSPLIHITANLSRYRSRFAQTSNTPRFQFSSIPIFHHSTIPTSHHSSIPSFQHSKFPPFPAPQHHSSTSFQTLLFAPFQPSSTPSFQHSNLSPPPKHLKNIHNFYTEIQCCIYENHLIRGKLRKKLKIRGEE